MKFLEANNPIGTPEFMVECECHCSILRFSVWKEENSIYLLHYGHEDPRVKVSQDFQLSLEEAKQVFKDLNSKRHSEITLTPDHSGIFKKYYKKAILSFHLIEYSDEGDRYIEVEFRIITKYLNKTIIGWGTIIPNKNVDSFLKNFEYLIKEIE